MATLDEIEFNELVIVARHQGEVSTWKCWKRDICAFNDPKMWQDTKHYSQYFERIENDVWTMAGYGVIVMDLDNKTTWSFNDYSSPWSFLLPNPTHYKTNPTERTAMLALLSDPTAWNYLTTRVHKQSLLGKGERRECTLADLLPEGIAPEDALKLLETSSGDINIEGETLIFLHGRYVPAGWKVGCEIGKDGPDGLIGAMETWLATGLVAPSDWEGFDNFMTRHEVPITDEEFEGYLDEAADEEDEVRCEMIEIYDLARRYRECKTNWSSAQAVVARPKGP